MAEGFYKIPEHVAARKDLTCAAKLVYGIILRLQQREGFAWAGYRYIARMAGLDKGTVGRAVESLLRIGLITREPGKGGGFKYRCPQNADSQSESSVRNAQRQCPHSATSLSAKRNGSVRKTRTKETRRENEEKKEENCIRSDLQAALCELFGLNPATSSEHSRIRKLVRDLEAKGASVIDLRDRHGHWVRRCSDSKFVTPEAVLKHWDELNHEATNRSKDREAKPGIDSDERYKDWV